MTSVYYVMNPKVFLIATRCSEMQHTLFYLFSAALHQTDMTIV